MSGKTQKSLWQPIETAPNGEEVLALVDGHRGPAWSNTHCVVAYKSTYSGQWFMETVSEEVFGVIAWMPLPQVYPHPEFCK